MKGGEEREGASERESERKSERERRYVCMLACVPDSTKDTPPGYFLND